MTSGLYKPFETHICCICNDIYDDEKRYAHDYAISGRGRKKVTNWFHRSCFIKEYGKHDTDRS